MADQCAFYYYDGSFFVSNSYCCRLLESKGRDYRVGEDWANQYCRRYNHEKCPYFNNRSEMSSNDSGCYLTSACVLARGMSDDCYELQILRHFRDTYLASKPDGASLIREYYDTAPGIVQRIDKLPNAKQVYDRIFEELIIPCIRMIEAEERENAFLLYQRYTKSLLDQYCCD